MPRRRRISPEKLLKRVIERTNDRLINLNREYTEYVKPTLIPRVKELFIKTFCDELLDLAGIIDDEAKLNQCINLISNLVKKYEEYFREDFILNTWVTIHYFINEKIYDKIIEYLRGVQHG